MLTVYVLVGVALLVLLYKVLSTFVYVEGARRRHGLVIYSFCLTVLVLLSFAVFNYATLSELIKSTLTVQQIEYVRSMASSLTGDGGVVLLLQTVASELTALLAFSFVALGWGFSAYTRRESVSCSRIDKQKQYLNIYEFSSTYSYSPTYMIRMIQ